MSKGTPFDSTFLRHRDRRRLAFAWQMAGTGTASYWLAKTPAAT